MEETLTPRSILLPAISVLLLEAAYGLNLFRKTYRFDRRIQWSMLELIFLPIALTPLLIFLGRSSDLYIKLAIATMSVVGLVGAALGSLGARFPEGNASVTPWQGVVYMTSGVVQWCACYAVLTLLLLLCRLAGTAGIVFFAGVMLCCLWAFLQQASRYMAQRRPERRRMADNES